MKRITILMTMFAGLAYGGAVTGVVMDGQGKPIEGARIWVKPSLTTGLVEARTDEKGQYHAEGLIPIPYNTYAWMKTTYREKNLCMRVAPAKLQFHPESSRNRETPFYRFNAVSQCAELAIAIPRRLQPAKSGEPDHADYLLDGQS